MHQYGKHVYVNVLDDPVHLMNVWGVGCCVLQRASVWDVRGGTLAINTCQRKSRTPYRNGLILRKFCIFWNRICKIPFDLMEEACGGWSLFFSVHKWNDKGYCM